MIQLGMVMAVMEAQMQELERERLMEMSPEERECELELRRIRAIENIKPKFSIF